MLLTEISNLIIMQNHYRYNVIMFLAQPSTSKTDKATMISSDLMYNSPEIYRLKQTIELMKKEHAQKIKNMQQNLRRSNNKIAKLKDTLDTLKKR